jgi:hypothetical protein
MSKQAFGLSLQGNEGLGVVLQPPSDKNKGFLFVVRDAEVWRLDLTDSLVTQHRINSGIPDKTQKGEAPPSAAVANYTFINDILKDSINRGAYSIEIPADIPFVHCKYIVTGVEYDGLFKEFFRSSHFELLKTAVTELNRIYGDVEGLIKEGADQGLSLELKSEKLDPLKAQKIKEMTLMRKHVSAANPLVRAKKVQKGFGSK